MRLHVVDGTFELYRAHFSPRPGHEDASGVDVKATVGVLHSLLALLDDPEERATHLAVAFDNPIVCFRNELFDGYKTDAGVPPELRAQFDLVEEATRALGVVVWSMNRYEADDALATAAKRFASEVEQVRILTPDKDLGQCVQGTRVVQVDRIRHREIDEAAVLAARGVPPALIPDWLGLMGDDADGIPGIPGFGAKTAAAVLARFGSLEAIPADPAAWAGIRSAPRLAEALARERTEAALYKRLATLVTDVPLEESLDDLAWRGARRSELEKMAARLAAPRLLERVKRFG